nr:unnamed protein product [Spirometra erinaceieuropaei]
MMSRIAACGAVFAALLKSPFSYSFRWTSICRLHSLPSSFVSPESTIQVHRDPPPTSANVHPGVQDVILAKFQGNATLPRRGSELLARESTAVSGTPDHNKLQTMCALQVSF